MFGMSAPKTGPNYANRAFSTRAPESVSLNPATLGPLGNVAPMAGGDPDNAGLEKPGIRRKRLGKYEVLS